MSKKVTPAPDEILPTPLAGALSERYLAYALSTIMDRALPDVRDGLKPVHRRLMYAMRQLKLDPSQGFKKSARVVGEVIGRFHPHGDQAIYDALVRLAQDFAVRYPLIDGQGNFGNVDGDNAAAMRYTESRLTEVAQALLEGIDEDTVDFRATYDGEDSEPVVLPAAFPNLLANGSTGIAVGMATSIPPHNASELCDAALHLIKTPNATAKGLMKWVKGPDFPTGGVVVETPEDMAEAYKTGRGGFRVRARWHREDGARGTYVVVVTEVPYQVQKSKLIEKLAELIHAKKLPLLADVRDESAEDIRLVLEPRNGKVDETMLMESLFKTTDLESRISLNMNVLERGLVPKVMSLPDVLRAYLDHQQDVLVRRSNYRLAKIEHRLEILNGYLIVYLNLDEVIRIVREEDEPKVVLMKTFKLTDIQADAILNMRLRSLRRLEEMEIKTEHKNLTAEAKGLRVLLKSDDKQWKQIADDIKAIKERFGQKTELGKRRTTFSEAPDIEFELEEVLVEKEPITVVCSDKGWIRAMKGHLEPGAEIKYREGDKARIVFHAQTTDKLLAFGTNGRFYMITCDKLPGGRGHGEPIRLLIDLGNDEDLVQLMVHDPERTLLVASTTGHGFIVLEEEVVAAKKSGKQVLNVKTPAEAQVCAVVEGDHVAVLGENRKLLIFGLDQVPQMARGKGVLLQRYKDGGLQDAKVFCLEDGLSVDDKSNRTHTFTDLRDWMGNRANAGRLPPKGFPRTGKL